MRLQSLLNKGAQLSPQLSTNRKFYLLVKPVEQRSNSQYGARLFKTSCPENQLAECLTTKCHKITFLLEKTGHLGFAIDAHLIQILSTHYGANHGFCPH